MTALYWIIDNSCTNVHSEGYVGITEDPRRRWTEHKRSGRFVGCEMVILYEGTREECFLKEHELRPEPYIGWNTAPGGVTSAMYGRKHTEQTKLKMSEKKAAWHRANPDFKPSNPGGHKGKKKPPGHSEKLRAIAKLRKKKVLPDGSWTWHYPSLE